MILQGRGGGGRGGKIKNFLLRGKVKNWKETSFYKIYVQDEFLNFALLSRILFKFLDKISR